MGEWVPIAELCELDPPYPCAAPDEEKRSLCRPLHYSELDLRHLLLRGEKSRIARQLVRRWLFLRDAIKARPTKVHKIEDDTAEIWRHAVSEHTRDDAEMLRKYKWPRFSAENLGETLQKWVFQVDVGQFTICTDADRLSPAEIPPPSHGAWVGCILILHQQLVIPHEHDKIYNHLSARIKHGMAQAEIVHTTDRDWLLLGLEITDQRADRRALEKMMKSDMEWLAYT